MRTLPLLTGLLLAAASFAQPARPLARIDSSAVLIGQQAHVWLSVTYRVDKGGGNIVWPSIPDTLTSHIEVVRDSGVDTVMPDKNDPYLLKQARTLTITSWDSGYWAIPPFKFVINGDSVETEPLLFSVNAMHVDTLEAFRDIKDIYEVSYTWKDWLMDHWKWLAAGLGAAILVAAVVIVLMRRKRRPQGTQAPAEPELPLDVRTLNALETVKGRNLWQQGQVKQYHSEVTDILRGYIEQRFGVPALERTTDELVSTLKGTALEAGERERLANLLRLADLVKFAKYTALPAENEQLIEGAMAFVRNTHRTTSDGTHA
ncbi:MAG: hypothetical protein QM724_10545 [Flavobacteriales bacterium]